MSIRTDLALERLEIAKDILPQGVTKDEKTINDIKITTVKIQEESGANIIGKPIGEYTTFEVTDFKGVPESFETQVQTIADEIVKFIPTINTTALIVGLGNNDITPDALGPRVISYSLATRHITGEIAQASGLEGLQSVSAIAPGVLGQTGIETAQIIHSLCNELKPSCVIVVDALASKSIERLGTTVQVSNTGISPGSGVANKRQELSEQTLGVPVISVGVPTVVDMTTIAYDLLGENESAKIVSDRGKTMMVTPREIDVVIEHAAKTVAFAINKALQPSLSLDDLMALVG